MAVLRQIAHSSRVVLWATAIFGAGAALPAAFAAPPVVASSEAVYAAFTLNLTRFVSWPGAAFSSADAPFVIGTFPRDPINPELDAAVQGETVDAHPVVAIRLRSLDDLSRCQVVYVSRGAADLAAVVARVAHRPILTISNADGFLQLGGHVRFVPERTRTGLQVSAVNLRASGLEARAQLLRIASSP